MTIRRVLPIAAVIAVAAGGCDLLTDSGARVIGLIGVVQEGASDSGANLQISGGEVCPARPCSPDEPPIDAADTVRAGESFQIVVWSIAQGGCEQADGAEVSASDMLVEIVPYDRVIGHNCIESRGVSRDVSLVFPEPGDAVIRVTGRILVLGDSTQTEFMGSYDHPVVVVP